MERLTSLAVDDEIENSTIIFVSDNAGILSSIKQWPFRHMRKSEYRIYQNLQRLIARGNKVKFRHVISHAIDNSNEYDPKRCADTIGNQQVDQHCSAIAAHTAYPYDIISPVPVITTDLIKQAARRIQRRRMTFKDESSFFGKHMSNDWNDSIAKLWRKLPRPQAVAIGRLMTNHHNLQGHFFRLANKKNPQLAAEDDHMCRFCKLHLETPAHLLLNCTNPQVRAARFDHSITDYFIPLHNDEQNVANLLLAPEAWPTIYRFFSSLEISL
jgi:hypothetical protein